MHAQHIISEVNTLFLSFKIHDCSWERMVSEKYTSTFTSGKRTISFHKRNCRCISEFRQERVPKRFRNHI